MDELREAVAALFEAALSTKSRMTDSDDPPSKAQLLSFQKSVDQVQQSRNRLQTAMDAWSRRRGTPGISHSRLYASIWEVGFELALSAPSMLRRSASIRLTTFAGLAVAFLGAGKPALLLISEAR